MLHFNVSQVVGARSLKVVYGRPAAVLVCEKTAVRSPGVALESMALVTSTPLLEDVAQIFDIESVS